MLTILTETDAPAAIRLLTKLFTNLSANLS